MSARPLLVIVGPTASGKSALAMRIARAYGGEIIAADSRTVYRGMDIGTAKPTAKDQLEVPHHVLDVVNPSQPFSAAEFKRLAVKAIDDISARGKLPILVGGTGLYVDAVLFDYQFSAPADAALRAHLQNMSIDQLQDMCRKKDIDLPTNSHNKRHLIRAIETNGQSGAKKELRSDTLVVGITTNKETLRRRIVKRVRQMIEQGVLEEVKEVGARYGWQGEALKGNVYRIFRRVIEEGASIDAAIEELAQSDLNLAKRQMTWFKRHKHIVWSENPDELLKEVDTFLKQYR